MSNDGKKMLFREDEPAKIKDEAPPQKTWKILIVDDEAEVHDVTKLALRKFVFKGKGLTFLNAYSQQEAQQLVHEHSDLAVVLLDVVMEEDDSGLELVKYIREVAQNQFARLILRTGQPGQAPEKEVILTYDINDYKLKTELTSQKLFVALITALRSYHDLIVIERSRKELAETYAGLEKEIVEREGLELQIQESLERRTRQVQTSTEIAQEVAAAPILDELFKRVVDLVQERFRYYHAQVYTLTDDTLVLQEGTGEAGRKMKEAGHSIPLAAEKSLAVRAVHTGEPVLVPDVSQATDWLPNPLLPETKSELAIPIKLGAEVLGVLDVQNNRTQSLNDEDLLLLQGLCGQIASAIRSTRLFQQTQAALDETKIQADRLAQLNEMSTQLNLVETEEEIFNIAARHAAKIFAGDRGSVTLLNEKGDQFDVIAFSGTEAIPVGVSLPADKVMLGLAVRDKQVLITSDLEAEGRLKYLDAQQLSQEGIQACINAPLMVHGKAIGTINLGSKTAYAYTEQDESLIAQMTTLLSSALENLRLSTQMQITLEETETLYKASNRLTQATDSGELLAAVSDYVQASGANAGQLFYIDNDAQGNPAWVEVVAGWQLAGQGVPSGTRFHLPDFPIAQLWLAEPERPTLLADVLAREDLDPVLREIFVQAQVQATALLPLHTQGRWVGLLSFAWNQPYTFTDRDRRVFTALGQQMVSVVDALRTFQQVQTALAETEEQAHYLAALNELGTALSVATDSDTIFKLVADYTLTIIGGDRASLALLDETGDSLELFALSGLEGAIPLGMHLPIDKSAIGLAVREKRLIQQPKDIPMGDYIDSQKLAKQGIKGTMLAPLVVGGQVIGTLNIASNKANAYMTHEVNLMRQLVTLVVGSLENRRLFDQVEANLAETQTLYEIGQVLPTVSSLDEMLAKMLHSLNQNGIALNAGYITLTAIEVDAVGEPEWGENIAAWGPEGVDLSGVIGMRYPLKELAFTKLWRDDPANPVVVANIEIDDRFDAGTQAAYTQSGTIASVTLPLSVAGRWVGLLTIAWPEAQTFSEQDLRVYRSLMGQLAPVLDNQQLLDQIQQRAGELEETTQFLDSVLDNIPSGLFVKEAENLKFVRWNRANEDVTGWKAEEVLGKTDHDFFSQDEADNFVNTDRTILAGDQLVDIPEEEIHTAHRGVRFLHTIKVPILGADGQAKYLLGISEDITEQKQSEGERDQLLAEVQRLAAIVENHPDFIGVGTLDGRALYVNPAGLKMMGLPPDNDVTTMDASHFYLPADAERLAQEGLPTALAEGAWSTEANLLTTAGAAIPVEETIGINYDAAGNPVSFSITMRDIRERKAAEAEQGKLLAEVQAVVSRFVHREWDKFLGQYHSGNLRIEYQALETDAEGAVDKMNKMNKMGQIDMLADVQDDVLQAGSTKILSGVGSNGHQYSSAIMAPISLRGQVIGTLGLEDTGETGKINAGRQWTAEEIALVEAVSEQLALTVENLRLVDDTEKRATREQLARQITDKMHAAPDAEAIIQTGLTELAKVLETSRTYVKLTVTNE